MKKIIGGLLILTLSTHPFIITNEIYAYEFLKSQEKLIVAIVNSQDDQPVDASAIDEMFDNIDNNKEIILSLLKEKNEMLDTIQNHMDLRSKLNLPMSEQQMAAFQKFSEIYESEEQILKEQLSGLFEALDLKETKSQLIAEDTNYGLVRKDLENIHQQQAEAIYSINYIITAGTELRQLL